MKFTICKLMTTFTVYLMKIHLIKKQTIEDYCILNARSRPSFQRWVTIIKRVNWSNPLDILRSYSNADILACGTNRVVFNIGGNKYRMICKFNFGRSKAHLFICWIGTHAEYTKLCNGRKQYTINKY